MAITAADVKKLRTATGAGMMDCKKALQEADGDLEKAIEIIRKKGMAIANKRADREASEGVVLSKVSDDNKKGAIISLNCETDFVAKNEGFVEFATKILNVALEQQPADLEELKGLELEGGRTVETHVSEQTGIIGEKLELGFYDKIEAPYCISYIHAGNKLATLVGFNKENIDQQMAKDVAMQVAAMSPAGIDKDDVPEEVVNKELEIAKEKYRLEGKPENMLDKIAQGNLNKFYKENTLLNQAFVKDSKINIKQYLETADKDLTVTVMKRFSLNN
ncbi:translation elongation factor Ts (EF-Ts) [Balneicella halophila]|uniref:Elongation factor Ts n=1 Tax=Balneicella halophila TaxID=1537566 RepID=A0A7L4UQN5_BALHA|nr:translation elongation factor Ts [Balneicella halophila]PVX52063.1 translation elongation factor Ts (EF-Ts) [Balneicella halophila]